MNPSPTKGVSNSTLRAIATRAPAQDDAYSRLLPEQLEAEELGRVACAGGTERADQYGD